MGRRAQINDLFGENPKFAKGDAGDSWRKKPVLPKSRGNQWPKAILLPDCSYLRESGSQQITLQLNCGDAVLFCGSTLHAGPAHALPLH